MVGKVGFVALAAVSLGIAGYFSNQYLTCNRLEDDYLNGVSAIKNGAVVLGSSQGKDLKLAFEIIQKRASGQIETALDALYDRCETSAAETAVRKGSAKLLH